MSRGLFTPGVSKSVGWDKPASITYPSGIAQVNTASATQLLKWHRFLPSPETEERRTMIKRIMERLWG